MKLRPIERETLRMMFGGRCAYCGDILTNKWHADHFHPVKRDGKWAKVPTNETPYGYKHKWKLNGRLRQPEHDRFDNLVPACVPCNILKSSQDVEEFRSSLTYFATSIPTISTYSHVHHLMRFGKLSIDPTPVVFWFEKYRPDLTD